MDRLETPDDRSLAGLRQLPYRVRDLSLLIGTMIALSGCAAGIAAKAVGLAVQGARGQPQSNAHLGPAATQACSARAAQNGAVHIIDVEQRTTNRIIVWGTVGEGQERRSFECSYATRITGFKLRAIRPTS